MNKKLITISLTICLSSVPSYSLAQITIGAGVAVGISPYSNYETEWSPIPLLQLQNERFFIDNLKMGGKLFDNNVTKVDIHINYLHLYFKSSKTDDQALKQLEKRQSTLLAGVGLSHKFNEQRTEIKTSIDVDVLGKSNSLLIEAGISHNFLTLDNLMLSPSAGIIWANQNHNNYYYGVSKKESAKSGLRHYKAKASVQPYLGLDINYQLTEEISLIASGRINFLPSEVKNSPMVNKSTTGVIAVGVTYRFK